MSYRDDWKKSDKVSGSDWLRELYEKVYGSKIKSQEKISGYKDKRKYNYDKRVIFDNGIEELIEEKIRFRSITDCLVESHHEYSDGRREPGWIYKSKADIIAYISAPDKNMVLIDLKRLKDFVNSKCFKQLRSDGFVEEKRARNPKDERLRLQYTTINWVILWNIMRDNDLLIEPVKNDKKDANKKLDWYLCVYLWL